MSDTQIEYSENMVKCVKELSKDLADSSDTDSFEKFERWYLEPEPYLWRIKNAVLSIPEINNIISQKSKILEIGSGIGTSCIIMKALTGANVYGLEPAPMSYQKLHKCIDEFKICNSSLQYESINCGGEEIPYPDDYFDFIYSFEVLEHVANPKKVFSEIFRVLKPTGCAYIATCNYDSFYEGHYKCFWNPFIGVEGNKRRFIKKGYSLQFLDELNFITKKNIKKWCKEIGFKKIEFNPKSSSYTKYNELKIVYPEGYSLPDVKRKTKNMSYYWNKFLEKRKVAKIFGLFDREYKMYFVLSK